MNTNLNNFIFILNIDDQNIDLSKRAVKQLAHLIRPPPE
jgi:hypothetical protein